VSAPRPKHVYRRLAAEARPFSLHIGGLLILSVLSSISTLLIPVPLKIAVDNVIGSHPLPGVLDALLPNAVTSSSTEVLVLAVVLLVLFMLLKQLVEFATLVLSTYAGQKLLLSFRARLFRHVQRLSLSYHDLRGVTDSTYRIQYDAQSLQTLAIAGVIPFLTALFTVIGMLYVTTKIDWRLGVIALAVSPPLLVTFHVYRRRLRRQWHEAKQLESSALSVVHEALSALRVVKAFGREDHERERFVGRSGESMRVQVGLSFVEGTFGVLIGLIMALGTAAVLWVGTRNVQAGTLTVGDLVLVMAYLQQLYEPLQTISKKAGTLQSSLASAERVFSLLDQAPDLAESPHAKPLKRAAGAIAFRDVSFAYDSMQPALRDVSFELSPGTSVGIGGATGAGKTTLVSLLTRFYDPTSGQIRLDGVDLREYRVADLRRQFAIVLQEPVLFSTSIAENIAYARPDARLEEIQAAAAAANSHTFISRLPEGYDTPVGERGMRLSGGERQRISLARAFLKDAPILILDEPTSSVDVGTEATIMEAMERLMAGRTTIMIAHRLSTLEACDVRLEIDDGRLTRRYDIAGGSRATPDRRRGVPTVNAADPGDRRLGAQPPSQVVQRACQIVAGRGDARLLAHEPLKRSVHRLNLEVRGDPVRVILKRLSGRRAQVNERVANRWLPTVGLEWACPAVLGVIRNGNHGKVWHVYEDLGEAGLDRHGCDPVRVGAVVELVASLHGRFAGHALLEECRRDGEGLGMGFYTREVLRCLHFLDSLGPAGECLPREQAELRDRLLDRLERLYDQRHDRAVLLATYARPDTLLHGDLWTSNTFVIERDGKVEARLIDWDHAGVGPVTYDLSTFLYRFPPEARPWVLEQYREAASRWGGWLPADRTLNLLLETAEYARYACCLAGAARAALRGERWGFEEMAEIETWFDRLEPVLAEVGAG
jgi:ATP-binding cassette subfamily B protein